MSEEVDYRLLKFKAVDILAYLKQTIQEFKSSYDVCNYLKTHGVYPAKELYERKLPYVNATADYTAITYRWTYDVDYLLSFCGEDYVWLDIVNINQNSKDIVADLSILPKIYKEFDRHYVFSFESFYRGWCLLEICVANEEAPYFVSEPQIFDSDYNMVYNNRKICDNNNPIDFVVEDVDFQKCKFSVESDRQYVTDVVLQRYGSIDAFNLKMQMMLENLVKILTPHIGAFMDEEGGDATNENPDTTEDNGDINEPKENTAVATTEPPSQDNADKNEEPKENSEVGTSAAPSHSSSSSSSSSSLKQAPATKATKATPPAPRAQATRKTATTHPTSSSRTPATTARTTAVPKTPLNPPTVPVKEKTPTTRVPIYLRSSPKPTTTAATTATKTVPATRATAPAKTTATATATTAATKQASGGSALPRAPGFRAASIAKRIPSNTKRTTATTAAKK